MIDEDISFRHAMNHSEVPEYDIFDIPGVRYAYENDVALGPDRLGAVHHQCVKPVCLARRPVPHRDAVTCVDEIRRHSPSHDPETYESKSRHDHDDIDLLNPSASHATRPPR